MLDLSKFSQKRICVATSGGVDSLSLLHFLWQGQAKYGYLLSALHCEHGIRGEDSLADAAFVKEICEKWNIPLYLFTENCPKKAERERLSLETAARNFRLDCYKKVLESGENYIATAHHQDDEAETVLFRLARGTALGGMKGIEELNTYMVRPFLSWTRKDIEKYAQNNGLNFRTDSTNFQTEATRNKLRLEVLPKLEEAVAGASGNLVRFAKFAQEDDSLLHRYADKLLAESFEEEIGMVVSVAFSEEKPLFRRACLSALKKLGVEKDYTSTHLEALFTLQYSNRGSTLDMPQNVLAERRQNEVVFYKKNTQEKVAKPQPQPFTKNGFDGGMYEVNISNIPFSNEKNAYKVLRFDKDSLPKNAVFRFRKEGDEIQSFGGKKTLKKFFNEKKLSQIEREYLPLIAEENGAEVYVICGVEISEKIKITETTSNVLYVAIQKKKGD